MTLEQQIADREVSLARNHAAMLPMQQEVVRLNNELSELRSRKWIADHGVTPDNLQNPPEDVWHGIITDFRNWLVQTGNTKPFVSWNGIIMSRSTLDSGRWMWPDLYGRVIDITNPKD